jgi:hypothetical protein
LLLDLAVGVFAGFAEPRRPLFGLTAGFGAPLSIWDGPGWPMWLGLGLLLSTRRYYPAAVLLLVHYATIPFAISRHLQSSSFEAEFSLFAETGRGAAGSFWVIWGIYLLGQVGAWVVVARGLKRERGMKTAV